MTINIITLGCSKNSVDSEVVGACFQEKGHRLLFESDKESDIVLINTCSFIKDAKEESIDEIFIQLDRKKKKKVKKVFVMGCLAQRYKNELMEAVPEVDGFYTYEELPLLMESEKFDLLNFGKRILTTPSHYAYMKVSEGCDRRCAFCAIPMIRGKQVSKTVESLVAEAELLVGKGVKELILIAQDLTAYGTDLYKQRSLDTLLQKLATVKGLDWIRLHYAYPNDFPLAVLDVMRGYPQFCHYLDIPFQHVSEHVLKAMNRPSNPDKLYRLIDTFREKLPDIALRTTLLSGFPAERDADHKELCDFVKKVRFDRLGVFSYSREEGTPAYSLGDPVPEKEKGRRVEELMLLQEQISYEKNEKKIGKVMNVLIDREEEDFYLGRTEYDSPEVDNAVLIPKTEPLKPGKFYLVKITEADSFDLFGELNH